MTIRIGNGFDAHQFKQGGKLILGGVEIPHHSGMEAHSDGDVVLHALCDSILGALAKGDIGQHFPDNADQYSGIDSRILLRQVYQIMSDENHVIGNVDITIIAQTPKLAAYVDSMCDNIAQDLHADKSSISIKATTTERMGFTGREEGIAVMSSVLIFSKD
ncbi:2-C-methyl-D-erythritol 2,4-cyclodiphosphate synthase [hydrothermal vent metagenome]|uniref:2-C-methyl-D-erythritol 2,4-cyclodiphosphate synthase n=1 Tax=hydrothermal vent metagenome TaxID=652676 RepID=A0A3B1ABB3_9ZZZZ